MDSPPDYSRRPSETSPQKPWDIRRATSVRLALFAGFALVFGLWLLWGYQLARSLQQIQQNVAAVHDSYLRGDQSLSSLRVNVLLGSVYLRDALIDTELARRPEYGKELARLRNEIDELVVTYVPDVSSPVERDNWERLQSELSDYWAATDAALNGETRTPREAAALLRRSVVPQRDTVLQVLDQLAALQTVANERRRFNIDILYEQVRTRLLAIGSVTLLLGFFVAFAASRQVDRLQQQEEHRRHSEQQNREELERLSARLVSLQEQERRTISRELHDEVGQALTAVKMDIGIALRTSLDGRVRAALEEARDISEAALRSVRDMSQLLHPSVLDDFGLPSTLSTYLRKFSERSGIRAELITTATGRFSPEVEMCVYRVVQEAFNNVARHSGATTCTATLDIDDGHLRLVIEDNGIGIQSVESPSHGLGLIGMRERAQALGGTFTVLERPEGGTILAVRLPLQNRDAADDTHESALLRTG